MPFVMTLKKQKHEKTTVDFNSEQYHSGNCGDVSNTYDTLAETNRWIKWIYINAYMYIHIASSREKS